MVENASAAQLRERFPALYKKPFTALAISGGGSKGAFTAGLINGWTAAGTRPKFSVVTGISTGALCAPFVFLGSAYDAKLKEVYTEYSTKDMVIMRSKWDTIRNDSAADTAPLRKLIAKYIDESVMQEIAAEYRKGRFLYISTTNLDAMRPVVWNIGRIAASGAPGALDLIHDAMLASACRLGLSFGCRMSRPSVRIESARTKKSVCGWGTTSSQASVSPCTMAMSRAVWRPSEPAAMSSGT